MKTSLKKLTSVFLAVLMVMTVFSVIGVAAADTNKTKTGGYTVVLDASNAGVDAVEWKAWTWATGSEGYWAEAHGTNNSDITFDSLEENIIFAYFSWGTGTPDQNWTGKIAQSGNMTVQGSTFTVTNANGTVEGNWSGDVNGGGGNGDGGNGDGGYSGGSGSGYTVVLDASQSGVDAVEWKAWTWADGSNGHWAEAHGTNNSDITFDSLEKNIIFACFTWGTGTPNEQWGGKIAQSGNMTVEGATFTVTNANGTVEGNWSGDPVMNGGGENPTGGGEYTPGGNTVYLDPGNTSGTWYVWSYSGGAEGQFISSEDAGDGKLKFSGVSSQVLFVNTSDGGWTGRVGQTGDSDSYVTDGQMFTISGETEGDDGFGTPITVYTGSWGEGPIGGGDPTDPVTDPIINTDPVTDPVINTEPVTDPVINTDPVTDPIINTDPVPATQPQTSGGDPTTGLKVTTALNGATINTIDCTGTSVTVTYNLQAPLLLEDGQGTLKYDASKLQIQSFTLPNIQSGLISNKNVPGEAYFNFTGVNAETNSGIFDFKTNKALVIATFNVVGSGATTINLDMEELDALENGQQIAYYTNKVAAPEASSITQSLANPTVDVQGGDTPTTAPASQTDPVTTPQTQPSTQVQPTTVAPATQPTTDLPTPVSLVKLSATSKKIAAGKTFKLSVIGASAKAAFSVTSGKKNIALSKKSASQVTVTGLKKGTSKVTVKVDGKTLTCKVTVKNSPKIKVAGKKFKATKTYTIKKGKTLKVKITGKAKAIKNKYKSTSKKVAKVTSKKTKAKIKIKGLKKGKATIKVTVNKYKTFKIKVKVK